MGSTFNHSLLLLARQYRERSQIEVAAAAGLNQGHYSRIESGLLPEGPSSETVERISTALKFPISFFYEQDNLLGLPLSVHPMHRKKQSVGERSLKKVHAELNLRLMHLRKLLQAIEATPKLPLPWIDVDEGGGPREIARKIRTTWMLPRGPIANLTEIIERAGILVVWCTFEAPIDGVTMRAPDLPACIFINKECAADRIRFSLAHELGHVIMHKVPTDNIEDEANEFAAELLVPAEELRRDLIGTRLTLERLARLKAHWKVSMQFILYQAMQIGHINHYQSQYLWKQISRLGWRTREPAETDFPREEPKLFPHIVNLHLTELGYSVGELEELLRLNAADMRELYGMHDAQKQRAALRLVK